jgi:hypothetical protein
MRRSLAAVLALIATLMLAGGAVAAPVGITTINLRTWEGSTPIDGVRVCLARGGDQIVCGGPGATKGSGATDPEA